MPASKMQQIYQVQYSELLGKSTPILDNMQIVLLASIYCTSNGYHLSLDWCHCMLTMRFFEMCNVIELSGWNAFLF